MTSRTYVSALQMEAAQVDKLQRGRDQPFYHCLVAGDASDGSGGAGTGGPSATSWYVAEENLALAVVRNDGFSCSAGGEAAARPRPSSVDAPEARSMGDVEADAGGHMPQAAVQGHSRTPARDPPVIAALLSNPALGRYFRSYDRRAQRFYPNDALEECYPEDAPWAFERWLSAHTHAAPLASSGSIEGRVAASHRVPADLAISAHLPDEVPVAPVQSTALQSLVFSQDSTYVGQHR